MSGVWPACRWESGTGTGTVHQDMLQSKEAPPTRHILPSPGAKGKVGFPALSALKYSSNSCLLQILPILCQKLRCTLSPPTLIVW